MDLGEGEREGGREGGREGEREGGRERGREGGREGGRESKELHVHLRELRKYITFSYIYIIIIRMKNILKMNKEVGMLLPQKRPNTSGVGKSNNYYEDIYIPPYNNTD